MKRATDGNKGTALAVGPGRGMDARSAWKKRLRKLAGDKYLHLLALPMVVFFAIFAYYPMYGIIIAFKDFSFSKGILGSPWAANFGFQHMLDFFDSIYFGRLVRNTVLLSLYSLIFSFPIPIVFALLLNEVRNQPFKRVVQSVSYFPYFVSVVITVGIMRMLLHPNDGVINRIIVAMGGKAVPFMQSGAWFRTLFIVSGIRWAPPRCSRFTAGNNGK